MEEANMDHRQSADGSFGKWLSAFLVGLLFGGLVGAAAALLLAPRSGRKTRSQLQKQGENLFEQVTEGVDDVVTHVGSKAGHLADGIQKGVEDLQKSAQGLVGSDRK